MPRVLVGAESFGFGPAAKLRSVCARLTERGYFCHFVGEGAALTFAEGNRSAFASVTGVDSMLDLATTDPGDVDVAVSVMDPFTAVWARANDVPCVYVDSLLRLWQWPTERLADLQDRARELAGVDDAERALRAAAALPMHDAQYVAHALSTVNCVQYAPDAAANMRALRPFTRLVEVDAIIDRTHHAPVEPSYWLATASGMVNPLLPRASAIEWLRIVGSLIEEATDAAGSPGQVLLAGNPEVLGPAGDVASDRIRPLPLDHDAMLRALNGAYGCLAPPGLTTTLECAGYGVPVILLPEQHYGHLANFQGLAPLAPEAFPHGLLDPAGAPPAPGEQLQETLAVADRLRRHHQERDATWQRMVAGVADGMRRALRDRAGVAAAQKAVVDRFVRGYDGVEQVVAAVGSVVTAPVAAPRPVGPGRHG